MARGGYANRNTNAGAWAAIQKLQAQQALAGTLSRLIGHPGRAVTTGNYQVGGAPLVGGSFSNGTDTSMGTRRRHKAGGDLGLVRLVYYNGHTNAANTFGITVRAGLEHLATSTKWPVYFEGVRDKYIAPGGVAVSDAVPLDVIKGDLFFTNTWVRSLDATGAAITGGKWPLYTYANESEARNEGSDYAAPDITTGGNYAQASGYGYFPFRIVADDTLAASVPSVTLYGDSIMEGSTNGSYSYPFMALNAAGIPSVQVPRSTETIQTFGARDQYTLRKMMGAEATHAMSNYGVNDLAASRTAAQVANDNLSWADRVRRRGTKLYQLTVTPDTALTGPQATQRANYNAWMRAGAPVDATTHAYVAIGTANALTCPVYNGAGALATPGNGSGHPFAGVFDPSVLAELTANTWKVGYSDDGLHPNGTGHNALIPAIPASLFASVSA